MSSLRRRDRSPFWYACIRGPDGKAFQFSTGLTDETQALAVAAGAEAVLRKGRREPGQLRSALERLAAEYAPDEKPTDPGGWLREWAKSRRGEVADKTLVAYTKAAGEAAGWMEANGVREFGQLTQARVTELRSHWLATVKPGTVNLKMKILRCALADAGRAGLVTGNPAADVAALRSAATVRREFRPAELDALLPTLTGEWRALVMLGLYTGQRLNDLVELRWASVDLDAETIIFPAKKTGALVALPLMPPAVAALAPLGPGKPDAAVFPTVAAQGVPARSKAFRRLLAKVGLAPSIHRKGTAEKGRDTNPLSFHSLRHTATSMLKGAGVSDAIARAIVGHESAAVSRSYTHLDMATMRREMARMPGAGGLRVVGG